MTPAAAVAPSRRKGAAPTKWGDREARRRDILDAARVQMRGGYLSLNMRDIAAAAGVSPGTLYQYFSTKEEIFATLYAEAITVHNERLAPICERATDLESFLRDLATAHLDLYAAYGRHFNTWTALLPHGSQDEAPFPPELMVSLRDATMAQAELIAGTIRRITKGRTRRLVDEPIALELLWTVLNGLGDQLTSERRHLMAHRGDQLVAFAAKTLAAGLLTRA